MLNLQVVAKNASREETAMAIENISVIKLRDLLLVTVPPDPDDQTVSALQEQVLQAMARHECKGLVLDISTVQTLDSFFARTIAETVQMVALMGGRTVLAGHARQRGRHGDPTRLDDGQGPYGPGRGPGPGSAESPSRREDGA